MKKKLLVMLSIMLLVAASGCQGEKNEPNISGEGEVTPTPEVVEKESITLENGLIFTVEKKELKDSHGKYYANENGAVLAISIRVENPTDKQISFGSGNLSLDINGEQLFSKSFSGEDEVPFIEEIPAGGELTGTLVFPSYVSYTEADEVIMSFEDFFGTELGEFNLNLVGLEKEISDVTATAAPVVSEGSMLTQEMGGYTVRLGNLSYMTGSEFLDAYPEYSLDLKSQYRYLLMDFEFVNESGSDYVIRKNLPEMTDNFGDSYLPETFKMEKMNGEGFDVETDIADGETRTGKLLFIISVATEKITITTNPVDGVNSEFKFEFDIDIK